VSSSGRSRGPQAPATTSCGRIRRSVGPFWTPARSHIFSLLPALADAGLARVRQVEQEHLPATRIYEITQAGRDELGAWLASSELADGPARNPFLVKLSFGALLQPEEVAAHIRERRERIGIELAELEALERTIDRDASPFGFDYAA
jgi:DNA-binding PadR family transcriptional regulator